MHETCKIYFSLSTTTQNQDRLKASRFHLKKLKIKGEDQWQAKKSCKTYVIVLQDQLQGLQLSDHNGP